MSILRLTMALLCIAVSIFALYEFRHLRRNMTAADGKASAMPLGGRRRYVISISLLILLWVANIVLFNFSDKSSGTANTLNVQTSCIYGHTDGPRQPKLHKLYLLTNDADSTAAMFRQEIAQRLRNEFPEVAVETPPDGAGPESVDIDREMCLLLSYGSTHSKKNVAAGSGDRRSQADPDEELRGFRAELLQLSFGFGVSQRNAPPLDANFRADVIVKNNASPQQVANSAAEAVTSHLLALLRPYTADYSVEIPDTPRGPAALPQIEITELQDFQCLFDERSRNRSALAVYRFKCGNRERDLAAIKSALAEFDLTPDQINVRNSIHFSQPDGMLASLTAELHLDSDVPTDEYSPNIISNYGILILATPASWQNILNEDNFRAFYEKSPNDFVACAGLPLLPVEERLTAAKKYFSNRDIPLELRGCLLSTLAANTDTPENQLVIQNNMLEIFSDLTAEALKTAPDDPRTMRTIKSMADALRMDDQVYPRLKSLLGDALFDLDMTAVPVDDNGVATLSATISVDRADGRDILVALHIGGSPTEYFVISRKSLDGKKYRISCFNLSNEVSLGEIPDTGYRARYTRFSDQLMLQSYGQINLLAESQPIFTPQSQKGCEIKIVFDENINTTLTVRNELTAETEKSQP